VFEPCGWVHHYQTRRGLLLLGVSMFSFWSEFSGQSLIEAGMRS
jgi:hypothetical protein